MLPETECTECFLFVYGTLRAGESAHHLLDGARLVGEFRTETAYELMNMGPFPAMVEGGATAVAGEVYAIGARKIPQLDDYEDCPRLFYRSAVRLQQGPAAQAYFIRRERLAPRFKPIASGNWMQQAKR